MSDDFIHQFDPPGPPRPEFKAALYQRITHSMKATTQTRTWRAVAVSLAMLAMIAAVLAFSPAARAFAGSVIHQFQKGNTTVQNVDDAASASQQAGFTVLAPSYVPDGYAAFNQPGVWSVVHENGNVMAVITYDDQASNGTFGLSEEIYQPGETNTLTSIPEAQDVTVRGLPGKWISSGKSFLIWDENGINYQLSTNTLQKDEMLKIAESLGK